MKQLAIILICLFAVNANALTKEQIEEKFNLPPEPNAELNNSTIEGVDSNNNGIRDDIERAIAFKYYKDKKAVTLFNKESQIDSLLIKAANNNDKSTYLKLIDENGLLVECFFDYDESLVNDELLEMNENTTQRRVFRIKAQEKMLSGIGSISGPNPEDAREYCSKVK